MSASPKPKTSVLMSALAAMNTSVDAKGTLPPSTCKQQGSTIVLCAAPANGISGAVFQTYPNLKALYAAYQAEVASLNLGQFKQNFSDCQVQDTFGEIGWNHQYKHTSSYTVADMSAGKVTDNQAAGRVFCTHTEDREYMVWTQDDGNLMAYVAGPIHADVWAWWVKVHHSIGIGAPPMHM
jgi:hypothetical protein